MPSQQAPLHVSGPLQVVPHFEAEHALPVGQSPAALQPHVPPSWHTWPLLCVVQSRHVPPVLPQSVPPAAPVWHVPLPRSQHPVLHSSVTPPTTHVPPHPWVVRLHAWFAGQSEVALQPHTPDTHWLLPVHGPQAAPLVPHAWVDVAVMQVPVASQQPLGQLVGVHFATHVPAEHVCAVPHVVHDTPFTPQLPSDDVSHCPPAEQQPAGQLVGVHGTLASCPPSPAPVSVEPLSFGAPSSPPATSGAPMAS